jgi:hypothetical protein
LATLLGIVEDIFAFGLFHPVHIDGYLNVCKSYSQVESQKIIKAKPQLPSVKEGMTSCQMISNGSRSWQMHLAVAEFHEGEPFHIPGTQRVLDFSFKR